MDISKAAIVFPFSRINANALSALLAAIDIHAELKEIDVFYPNLNHPLTSLMDSLKEKKQIILAISLFSSQFDEYINKIKEFMQIFQDFNTMLIAGGPHAQGSPKSLLDAGIDVVCTGEGEIVFQKCLYNFISKPSCWREHLSTIKGIAFKLGDDLKKTGKADPVDLDAFPPFSIKHQLIRPIEITRGCAWNCRFCQTRNRNVPVKHRSLDLILEYIRYTIEYFSHRRPDIRFISPNALSYGSSDGRTVDLVKVSELLSSVRKEIGKEGKIYFGSFPSEIRPETVSEESIAILKQYTNVKKIIVGGQSGSNRILKNIKRGHGVDEVRRAVKLLISHGFDVEVDMIFGLPGESEEDVVHSIELMNYIVSIGATIHSHTFMPLPGTPLSHKPPGIIHELYLPVIQHYQQMKKISGKHSKQEKIASRLAQLREDTHEVN
ncbi:MAG: TIGR04013 family B12-binding domain/radical SAM domain-containing protein [Candidatus Heimdallarchaeota archaeon]|nr:TIGR04013 family B12-binding domain/radical SAM domain-containing protein [Candidatus Heimdallarchaeota archaeon]